jgi:hypothetical protein
MTFQINGIVLFRILYQGYKCISCNIIVEYFDRIEILNTHQGSFCLQQEIEEDKLKFSVEVVEVESTFL